jgi:acyl carrier protein
VLDRLGAVWKRLLGSEVTPDSNFLDLGGNSLTAVELMAAVRTEFGVRVGMVTLFDHPTLGEFADAIVAQGAR